MSSILRLSSYGSSSTPTTSHGHPRSPLHPAPHPPQDAFPATWQPGQPKPSDILVNRAHELKRCAKALAAYFTGIAQAHHAHSTALSQLSQPNKTPLPTPFQEAALFLPLDPAASSPAASLGGSGGEGWQQILREAKETNSRVAEAHADLASRVTKEVVGPLSKLRIEMKTHIAIMEKEFSKLVDAVQKERDLTAPLLSRLSLSLTQSSLPLSAPNLVPAEDPVLLRALVEAQLAKQVEKENELLASVKSWTAKTEERERETFEGIKRCWAVWESVNSATLLNAQQHSMFLSAAIDSIPSDAEWAHFLKLNHAVLPSTPAKSPKTAPYAGRGDPLTGVVMEGLLERQTSFLRSWKPAYFLLTPSGHLHVYPPPPPSSSTPSTPASPALSGSAPSSPVPLDSASITSAPTAAELPPLTPSATHLLLHSTPLLSLNLALCTLGPMPTPPDSSNADKKAGGKALEPVFTILETVAGNGTKHVIRCGGKPVAGAGEVGDGWEEMGRWVSAIGPFCSAPPPPPSPVLSPRSSLLSPTSASSAPPTLPARSIPLGQSPALPSLPVSPASENAPPPPLPPREEQHQQEGEEDLELDARGNVRSSLVISESGDLSSGAGSFHLPSHHALHLSTAGDELDFTDSPERNLARNSVLASPPVSPTAERRLMDGLGVVGAGLGSSSPLTSPPLPPIPPIGTGHGRVAEQEEEEETEDDDPDAGDLGRSIRPSHSSSATHTYGARPALVSVPRSGSVRSLAAAWEQVSSPPLGNGSEKGGRSPVLEEEGERERELEEPSKEEDDVVDVSLEDSVAATMLAPSPAHDEDLEGADSPAGSAPGTPNPNDEHSDREEREVTPEPSSEPATPKGKKGKKKRKSKGGAKTPSERPLPLPSLDPEFADLGLPSPHSPAFEGGTLDAGVSPIPAPRFESSLDAEADAEEGGRGVMQLEEVVEGPDHHADDAEEERKANEAEKK
ncbi:hypothetical protein JCM8097_003763 [Rhodosporidiobolus ruineniae]